MARLACAHRKVEDEDAREDERMKLLLAHREQLRNNLRSSHTGLKAEQSRVGLHVPGTRSISIQETVRTE